MASGAGNRCVIVRGFDFGTTHDQIRAHMSNVGNVESIDPVLHASGTIDKGVVRITYSSTEEAKMASAHMQQTCISGNSRYIDVITLDPQQFLAEHPNVEPERAQQFLAMYPEQQNAVMAKGTLSTARDPTAVLVQRMNQARDGTIQGFSVGEGGSGFNTVSDGCSVLVRGFDFGTTHEQIQSHMQNAGQIASINPVLHASGAIDKGVVRITYASPVEAKAAMQLNQTIIAGNSRYLDVMLLDPQEFLNENNFEEDKVMQFRALTPEQQLAVMSKGSLSSARNPNAVLVTRMSQARQMGKGSFGPAQGKGGVANGPYGGGGGGTGNGGDMNQMMQQMMMQMMQQMMKTMTNSSAGSSGGQMDAMAGSSNASMGGMSGSFGSPMGGMSGSFGAPTQQTSSTPSMEAMMAQMMGMQGFPQS